MAILDEIVSHKRFEVNSNKEIYPVKLLEQSIFFQAKAVSLKKYLTRKDKVGIIAEIKRRSPSRGALNENISVEKLSIAYMQAGASALSILTDNKYFGGKNEDLSIARKFNFCPILRKEFIIDEYQIVEAKSIGADVILLIARILTPQIVQDFSRFAKQLGLEVLLEVHSERELFDNICPDIDIVGVNNRNLDTLSLDTKLSFELAEKVPQEFLKISESGIDSAQLIKDLLKAGYSGFLIGETFMKTTQPEKACARLIREINRLGE